MVQDLRGDSRTRTPKVARMKVTEVTAAYHARLIAEREAIDALTAALLECADAIGRPR